MDEKAARIALIAAELNAESMAVYAEIQGMMAENEKRRRDGNADAYNEEDFNKLRNMLWTSINSSTERVRNL